MKQGIVVVLICLTSMCLAGIEVNEFSIEPTKAAPGDSVSVTVKLSGDIGNIESVAFIPREVAYEVSPFYLMQKKSDHTTWMMHGPVPDDAQPGLLHLELRVKDQQGKQLVVKGFESQTHGKAGMVEFKILAK